ncbi:exo-beta-N-acetylmuramidase NamZ family protein [Glaciecola petra]|uniref:DUF1343 domain-containing protein n=1 Tax=Glaciecola petra TaxID=3075602 RepID=A0ABU2ZRV3_9ALTE|nr:DUF1343 domain-containing protein [Aestuariibacter sp. P117]MDT0595360.1 DUF1343 domain-containing protein [Aestuariibacter sp. P117]
MNIEACLKAYKWQFAICISLFVFTLVACNENDSHAKQDSKPHTNSSLVLGIEQPNLYLPLLDGKKVGLVVNQTSMFEKQHLVDFLIQQKIDVRVMFAPEHGVRGNKGAGEHIDSGKDSKTGVAIQSIYGTNKTPPNDLMSQLDVVIFDIQDVGTRFYTYISSMHYMMEAAAKHELTFIVLDRPNPNGKYVDGPVLDLAFQSFVGMHPIPVLHGLSVAELALMIKGEGWIKQANKLDLHTIAMQNYAKSMPYELPIAPSPNLPNAQAIQLYPSLCFFEATALSVGRGTDFPFQVIGHNVIKLGDFTFTPVSKPNAAPKPKLQDTRLFGQDLRSAKIGGLDLRLLVDSYKGFSGSGETFFTHPEFMDKLAGTDQLRLAIEAGKTVDEIKANWQADLDAYKQMRQQYLLYPQLGPINAKYQ